MTETTSKVSEPGPLNICYSYEQYVIGVFEEILTVGADLSLSLLLVLGTLFLLLSCLVHPWYEDFCCCLIISCFFLFGCCLLEVCYFLKGNGGMVVGGRGAGRNEGKGSQSLVIV